MSLPLGRKMRWFYWGLLGSNYFLAKSEGDCSIPARGGSSELYWINQWKILSISTINEKYNSIHYKAISPHWHPLRTKTDHDPINQTSRMVAIQTGFLYGQVSFGFPNKSNAALPSQATSLCFLGSQSMPRDSMRFTRWSEGAEDDPFLGSSWDKMLAFKAGSRDTMQWLRLHFIWDAGISKTAFFFLAHQIINPNS